MEKVAGAIVRQVLPNGLVLVAEPMPHVRSVSIGIWLHAGSRREPAALNGMAHFIEHMVFKGTARRTAEQIAREMDSVGGHAGRVHLERDRSCFNAKVLDEHLPLAFDVLSDMVLRPLFAAGRHRQGKAGHSGRDSHGGRQSGVGGARSADAEFLARASAGLRPFSARAPRWGGSSRARCWNVSGRGTRRITFGHHRRGRPAAGAAARSGRQGFWRAGAGARASPLAPAANPHAAARGAQQARARAGAHHHCRAVVSAGAPAALRGCRC